jgi:hypothetical protein
MEAALIAGAVSIIVNILVQLINLLQADKQRREIRRAEWKSYLIHLMDVLLEARREYEKFLGTAKVDQERHAGIVGTAIAACLATNEEAMMPYVDGPDGLTPYFVKKGQDSSMKNWDSRNRDAMQDAVKCLAAIIKET